MMSSSYGSAIHASIEWNNETKRWLHTKSTQETIDTQNQWSHHEYANLKVFQRIQQARSGSSIQRAKSSSRHSGWPNVTNKRVDPTLDSPYTGSPDRCRSTSSMSRPTLAGPSTSGGDTARVVLNELNDGTYEFDDNIFADL